MDDSFKMAYVMAACARAMRSLDLCRKLTSDDPSFSKNSGEFGFGSIEKSKVWNWILPLLFTLSFYILTGSSSCIGAEIACQAASSQGRTKA